MTFTWKGFPLARSAGHAALIELLPSDELQRVDTDQMSLLITDLIFKADTESYNDLFKAAQDLVADITPSDKFPGYASRYCNTLASTR